MSVLENLKYPNLHTILIFRLFKRPWIRHKKAVRVSQLPIVLVQSKIWILFLSYPMVESLNQEPMPNFWHKKDFMLNYGLNKWAIVLLLQLDVDNFYCCDPSVPHFVMDIIHCWKKHILYYIVITIIYSCVYELFRIYKINIYFFRRIWLSKFYFR